MILTEGGSVMEARLIRTSGDPSLDAAVHTAIMGSAPFPPETRKVFSFVFTYKPPAPDMRKPL